MKNSRVINGRYYFSKRLPKDITDYLKEHPESQLYKGWNGKTGYCQYSLRSDSKESAGKAINVAVVEFDQSVEAFREHIGLNTLRKATDQDIQALLLIYSERLLRDARDSEISSDFYRFINLSPTGEAGKLLEEYRFEVSPVRMQRLEALISLAIVQVREKAFNKTKRPSAPKVLAESFRPFVEDHMTVQNLICGYIQDRGQSWTESTRDKYDRQFSVISELIGQDEFVHNLTREDMTQVFRTIQQLPVKQGNQERFKGMTAQDLIEFADDEELPRLTPKAAQDYIDRLKSLFVYAERRDMTMDKRSIVNHLDPIASKKATDNPREGFSPQELEKIFAGKTWKERPEKENGKFWVPLLSMYTGARVNELAQLYDDDIVQDPHGVWCIRIRPNTKRQQSVKNPMSVRDIPIHQTLLRLGFHRMAGTLERKLFPNLQYAVKGGFGKDVSKFFNNYLNSAKIKTPIISFHSFRHTWNHLADGKVPSRMQNAYFGWSGGGKMSARYGSKFTMKDVKETFDKLGHQSVDLSHLYID